MSITLETKFSTDIVGSFLTSAPVDLDGMAKALKLNVEYKDGLQENIAGSIARKGNQYFICINQSHSPGRKRFTLAHEIGHYILHRDLIGDGIVDNVMYRSTTQPDYVETEANQYAASILMPARLMQKEYKLGTTSFADMANKFGVSYAAAQIRMRELRLGGG